MLDRTAAPPLHEISAIDLPTAAVQKFANGARMHCIANHTQPVVRLDIVFNAGKWYEQQDGLSLMTSKLLLEGTHKQTAKQIADTIAYYGASLECNQGYDKASLTLYCLSKHLEKLLPLVCEVLTIPSFPEDEFKLLRQRTIQNIAIQKQKNSYLATERLTQNVYGPQHPYCFGLDADTLQNLTIDQIKSFYQRAYNMAEAEVFLCGDFGQTHRNMLSEMIGTIPATGPATEPIAGHGKAQGLQKDYIEMPDSLQSAVRVGCEWPLMNHPDYPRLLVLNEVLGGYFGSRLMKNIREDKGFTYGIYSTVSPKIHQNLFYIGTDVNFENTQDTLQEIYKEMQILQQELVPEDELDTVKNYMAGKFLNDVSNIFEQCDKYKNVILHGLSPDYYNRLLSAIAHITAPELQQLANQYWNTNQMYEVVAGKKK
ncbi:MAG: insulinase family protein [Hymenobacteraceae bacterium]|nr:insulinase family protein [Hymenobacteraceae bacterium]MDX5397413.1 insulinase family protein [Hymenobacteraceae bacterium]MDX5513491.1 insulinase family protein [Hymenobacteraceae bacterium]